MCAIQVIEEELEVSELKSGYPIIYARPTSETTSSSYGRGAEPYWIVSVSDFQSSGMSLANLDWFARQELRAAQASLIQRIDVGYHFVNRQ